MAEPTHLDILKRGAKGWNEWRAQNPSARPDLTEADLREADLLEANLQGAILLRTDLRQADLRDANLREANLLKATLGGANLRRADLREADLREANLREANLYRANLQGVILQEVILQGANLQGVDLGGAELQGANLEEVSLQGANLEYAKGLTQDQIERALGDETTTLPRLLHRPVAWRLGARAGNLGGAANDLVDVKDRLDFVHYVDAFAQLIDSPNTKPPLTIGIYGSWGTGKSFLLEKIEGRFQKNKNQPQPSDGARRHEVHVVHFNAWVYNASEVIWPSLVREIMNKFEETWSRPRRFADKFRRNARRQTRQFRGRLILAALVLVTVFLVALWQSEKSATTFADGAIAVGSAIAVLGVGGLAKLVSDTLANPLGQYVTALAEDSDYGRHIGYMTEIRKDLEMLEEQLRGNNGRILVVVDDLDRCEPDKAVEVLQAINLLLNIKSFIVCLGIDARVITAAVAKHYEGLLDEAGASGYEYLEKIVQIPFRIPQPSEKEINTFISEQMGNPKPPSREAEVEADDSRREGRPNEDADDQTPSGQRPPSPGVRQTAEQVAFTHDELEGFREVAPFLRPNPRHLKRLVNVYRLVRSLADAKNEHAILDKPAATIRWLVICAQWPYTSHAMLWQYAEKLEEWDGRIPATPPEGDPLVYLLNQVSSRLSRDKQHELDDDPESLRKLLERKGERLTWEDLQRIRQYTVNFNPAVEGEMWVLTEGAQLVESTGAEPSDMRISQAQTKDTAT